MKEVRQIHAARKVNDALATQNGPGTTHIHDLCLNDIFVVWRERKGWRGPYSFLGIEGESCRIAMDNGRIRTFRSSSVRPFKFELSGVEQQREKLPEVVHDPEPSEPIITETSRKPARIAIEIPTAKAIPDLLDGDYNAEVFLIEKETRDRELSIKLRVEDKITTPREIIWTVSTNWGRSSDQERRLYPNSLRWSEGQGASEYQVYNGRQGQRKRDVSNDLVTFVYTFYKATLVHSKNLKRQAVEVRKWCRSYIVSIGFPWTVQTLPDYLEPACVTSYWAENDAVLPCSRNAEKVRLWALLYCTPTQLSLSIATPNFSRFSTNWYMGISEHVKRSQIRVKWM